MYNSEYSTLLKFIQEQDNQYDGLIVVALIRVYQD